MSSVSLESVLKNNVRVIVVMVGSLSILPLGFLALIQFPELSTGVKIVASVGIFVLYGTVFTIGMRKWALTRIRYELDEGGLSAFTLAGQLRDRVRWDAMVNYVVDTHPFGPKMRFLKITRRHGDPIVIQELPNPEQRRAFGTFVQQLVAAAGERRTFVTGAPIREGISFYDTPLARMTGVVMLVLIVAAVGLMIAIPTPERDATGMNRIWLPAVVMAPFIYRTVFRRKPLTGSKPPRRGERL